MSAREYTKTDGAPVDEEVYFDSANIAESYSGIVLPFTCSFARRVYRQVYRDLLHKSGVSMQAIDAHAYVFENLLGFFSGRMYYHMNNWYRLAQFVPGYKRNKKNFERMITSNLTLEIRSTIAPSRTLVYVYPFLVVLKLLIFPITTVRFARYVRRYISVLRNKDSANADFGECKRLFSALENDLLRRWYVTLENDFFVMTYFGLLERFVPAHELHDILVFESKATEQVGALIALARDMQKDAVVWKAVCTKDAPLFTRLLSKRNILQSSLHTYLETFGGRFANELKLETVGIDEDMGTFLSVLELYASREPRAPRSTKSTLPELSFFRAALFRLVLRKFKKYASQREEFRLLRSNMFALTRRIVRRVGEIFYEAGALEASHDIFYVTVEEMLAADVSKDSSRANLKEIVRTRKIAYEGYVLQNPPSHFVTRDGTLPESVGRVAGETITARGVSPGVVRGRVKVMKEFSMPENIDFAILVTKHTDPGWTALLALSQGLIIEHGGVLSHASIVARELGIPAVIGAEGATDRFEDGQVVEIDGSSGRITVI